MTGKQRIFYVYSVWRRKEVLAKVD